MKHLYISIILLLVTTTLRAAGYCSLTIKVESPSGKVTEARVVVEEENGQRTERTTRQGVAEFCGLGINPVSVTVGSAYCNQVIVRNVGLEWNKPRKVSVLYDEAACQGESLPVAACTFLLRFVDSKRVPIDAVVFDEQKPFAQSHHADEYGRIFVRIAARQELSGIGLANGYKPAQINIPCISKNYVLEQMVILQKSGQQ
jgi:hypothetical protein